MKSTDEAIQFPSLEELKDTLQVKGLARSLQQQMDSLYKFSSCTAESIMRNTSANLCGLVL